MRALLVLLCLATGVDAQAQDATTPSTTTPSTTTPSATTPSTTTPSVNADAIVLEEQAFVAIDDKQWCLAMRLFEKAHSIGPAVGLLLNAARAAEFAGDLESAVLVHEQIKVFEGASKVQRTAAIKKAGELRKQLKSSTNTNCAILEVLQPPPVSASESAPLVEVEPDAELAPESVRSPPADLRMIGFTSAGVGGAVVVAGAVVGAIGLLPWFAHEDAVARVLQAERDRDDATAAQADQVAAREAWNGHGRLLTIAGGIAVGVGVAAVVTGLTVALTAPGDAP